MQQRGESAHCVVQRMGRLRAHLYAVQHCAKVTGEGGAARPQAIQAALTVVEAEIVRAAQVDFVAIDVVELHAHTCRPLSEA